MTRAAAPYVFAVLLTLMTAQAAVPTTRVMSGVEIVYSDKAEQQAPRNIACLELRERVPNPAPAHQSWIGTERGTPVLFQRPPPALFLFP